MDCHLGLLVGLLGSSDSLIDLSLLCSHKDGQKGRTL